MTVDLQGLQAAFDALSRLTSTELTFDVGPGVAITLRQLTPTEETAVQRVAQATLPESAVEEGTDRATFGAYLDAFKVETSARAIIAINGIRLDQVDEFPTGKKTPEGNPIMVSRVRHVRDILAKWPRPWIGAVFTKYGELLTQVEQQVSKNIEFEPADLDSEIEQLEARLEELKGRRDDAKEVEQSEMTEHVQAIIKADTEPAEETELKTAPPEEPQKSNLKNLDTSPVPAMAAPEPQSRQPITPQQAAPPPAEYEPAPAPVEQPAPRQDLGAVSQFIDPGDQDSLLAATQQAEAEWLRHRGPAPVEEARRAPPPADPRQVVVNQQGSAASTNPNFRPPR